MAYFPAPAETICFAERDMACDFTCQGGFCGKIAYAPWEAAKHWPLLEGERHNGGSNYAFADGHAKWYRPESTESPVNLHAP